MIPEKGKYIPISYFRRLINDLLYFNSKVPSVTIERRMNLGPLVSARKACNPAPSWSAIFTKAYGMASARMAPLRTSYITFPWARFYEHFITIATLNIDRQLLNERIVLYAHIQNPEICTLREMDAVINRHQSDPPESIPSFRAAVNLSHVPWPIRQFVWWFALNFSGPLRCHFFGTFGITSIASQGAGITYLCPLLTSQLHYGMLDAEGGLDMRLSFDHRVMDGVTAAHGLAEMEKFLLVDLFEECSRISGM